MMFILFYSPVNILNVSQIPQNTDDVWAPVLNAKDNNYVDKPCVKKKGSKKEVSKHTFNFCSF